MFMQARRGWFSSAASFLGVVGTLTSGAAPSWSAVAIDVDDAKPIDSGPNGLMLHGYDPVAYFDGGKPAKGDPSLQVKQDGLTWRFATLAHKAAFLADPAKYQPAYGGYCAVGTAFGHKAEGDPETGRVIDGKLYLNYSKDVQKIFLKDIPGTIRQANENWPKIKDVPPGKSGS